MPENRGPVKIILVTGYLGAGKTTLLNHILSNDRNLRAAVIVNDIGEVNIDEALIREGGLSQTDSVIPLTNGCICCSLSDDLAEQLGGIAETGDFDYIVIEASGICEPMPIAYTISAFCDDSADGDAPLALDNIVAVVDCARMIDEFDGGERLLDEDLEEDDVESLLVEQIEFCTTIVMNKVDLITPEQLGEVRAIVRSLQKDAVMIEAEHGIVPRTIKKSITDVASFIEEANATLEGKGRSRGDSLGHGAFYSGEEEPAAQREATAESVANELSQLPPEEVSQVLSALEEEMAEAAASMDFERAARLRDQVVAAIGQPVADAAGHSIDRPPLLERAVHGNERP